MEASIQEAHFNETPIEVETSEIPREWETLERSESESSRSSQSSYESEDEKPAYRIIMEQVVPAAKEFRWIYLYVVAVLLAGIAATYWYCTLLTVPPSQSLNIVLARAVGS